MDFNKIGDLKKQAPTLAAIGNLNPFTVPTGYFEDLQDQLNSSVNMEGLRSDLDFTVPSGYFEDLQEHLISRIMLEDLKKDNAFTVPEAYFETLPVQIESSIFAYTLKENNASDGFNVPAGYFNGLQHRIIAKVELKRPNAKIISFRSFVQYAAAACVSIVIGAAIYTNQVKSVSQNHQELLAAIPDEEIISYLQLHSDAADTPVILENLDNKSSNNLPDMSEELSDEELRQYISTIL